MIEKEFVPHRFCLELKKINFDESCFKYIYVGDTGNNYDHYLDVKPSKAENFNADSLCISQPTFSQAFRWFRKKHNLIGLVECGYDYSKNIFTYVVWDGFKDNVCSEYFSTFEEAELECLKKLIEIVKTKL
jgi:hypothetical protein